MSLYRDEALQSRARGKTSQILIVPDSHAVLIGLWLFVSSALVLGLVLLGERSRKVESEGLLVAEKGESILIAGRPGVVTKLYVAQGAQVHAAQPIAEIWNDEADASGTGYAGAIQASTLKDRLKVAAEQHDATLWRNRLQTATISRSMQRLTAELAILANQIDTQKKVVKIAEDNSAKYAELYQQNYISMAQRQSSESGRLEQIARLDDLYKERNRLQGQLDEQADQHTRLPMDAASQKLELRQTLLTLQGQLSEFETRNKWIVVAPRDGVIGNLSVKEGDALRTDSRIATIVNEHGGLELEIYVPSSAIGFMKIGNQVSIRYDAYPYEKYGQFKAQVREVASTPQAVSPQDVNSSKYRVKIKILQDAGTLKLMPGMTAKVSIILERRKLWEWLLLPLWSTVQKL